MRKIFILGGSQLQLDLILEAKKMFFYTIVLDMNKTCIGAKWCDEFLPIDISDKELILEKAREYQIDAILTSATELGNLTACWVGEALGLNSNTYEVAINTSNKEKMKEIFLQHNIRTARYQIFQNKNEIKWDKFPCIVKPTDSSAGRGVSYCANKKELLLKYAEASVYSKNKNILIEEYILGEQFSIETISVRGRHQVVTVTKEYIRDIPNIVETHQEIPAKINNELKKKLESFALNILDKFKIQYGACHIEVRVDIDANIYIIELASRIGGWRTEMISLALGVNYSQLLLFSALNIYRKVNILDGYSSFVKLILDERNLEEYKIKKSLAELTIFEPQVINTEIQVKSCQNLAEAYGYYFILEKTQ